MNNTTKFGKLESETRYEKIIECRQIVKNIKDYGVTDEQVMVIIRLLSLNLENHKHSAELSTITKEMAIESGNSLFLIDSEEKNG